MVVTQQLTSHPGALMYATSSYLNSLLSTSLSIVSSLGTCGTFCFALQDYSARLGNGSQGEVCAGQDGDCAIVVKKFAKDDVVSAS